MKMLSISVGLLAGFARLLLTEVLVPSAHFSSVIGEEIEKERRMLQEIMKNTIKESTPEQLTEMYHELVKAISMRSTQGIGTDEALSEMVAEVVAEMNARGGGVGACRRSRAVLDRGAFNASTDGKEHDYAS